jgi:hypothetical protein
MRTSSVLLIALAIASSVTVVLPVSGLCTSPTPMCGGGGGSTYFTVETIPTDLQVAGGSQGTVSVVVTSVGCFVGTVSLQAVLSPAANVPAVWVSPTSVSVSCNGSASSTLYVSAVNTPGAIYVVTVSGSSGSMVAPGADVYVNVPFPSDPFYSNQWAPRTSTFPTHGRRP